MKKVISLLLALVMTLSLCSSALATGIGQEDDKGAQEEEYTMDTLLAEVDKVEGANDEAKAAAKEFLADNFIYDGRFVVLKDISFWDNRFYGPYLLGKLTNRCSAVGISPQPVGN